MSNFFMQTCVALYHTCFVVVVVVFPFYNHQQCLHYRCPNMAVKEADEDEDIGEDIADIENVVISKQLFSFFLYAGIILLATIIILRSLQPVK